MEAVLIVRILFVSQWFEPEPVPKGLAFVKALAALGHEVEVLTGFPNYPGGQLYLGYPLKAYRLEHIDGIKVHRVYLYPSHDQSGLKRALNYLSFMCSALVYGLFFVRKPDAIYCYHPPLTSGLAVSIIGWLRRIPFVYDIQDLWPDTLQSTGMIRSQRLVSIIGKFCNFVYRRAGRIVVLSPGFGEALVRRAVPADKIDVIYNWCDESALAGSNSDPPGVMQGKFNIVFAGTMGRAQALESVIGAARIVSQLRRDVQFVFVGGGVCLDELKAQAQGLVNVVFLPRMPMSEVGSVLQAAQALLVHLKDDPLFAITIPSKTQAYMATGKPILMAVRGNAADLVDSSGAGLCAEPENPKSIARAVMQLAAMDAEGLAEMGRKGRDHYFETMSLEIGARRFSEILRKAADDH